MRTAQGHLGRAWNRLVRAEAKGYGKEQEPKTAGGPGTY